MRMIGIGLFGFLLAGVALLLSTLNIVEKGQRYVRDVTNGPHLVFEHRVPAIAQDSHTAKLSRANSDHPVILSGLPAYQSIAFMLPVDARPTSGYLQIDATSQVLDDVEGVLRISVHNTKRAEMLLRPGEVGRSLQIPLSPADFAGDQLVVTFSLQGAGPQNQCGADDGIQAIVEIETTSAVFLTLDRPLASPTDHIRAEGNVVRVTWTKAHNRDGQLQRLMLATEFQRRGVGSLFVTHTAQGVKGAALSQLRAALPEISSTQARPQPKTALAQRGANAGLRRFYKQTTWRDRFTLSQTAGQTMATHLDLHLLFARLPKDQQWGLTVTLNNRLVFQDNVDPGQGTFEARIDLPEDIQTGSNTVEVVATAAAPQSGPCDQGPERVAEMLPSSQLVFGSTPFVGPMSGIRAALRKAGQVQVAMSGSLTAVDADIARHLLAETVPMGVALTTATAGAHITVLSPGQPIPTVGVADPAWVVQLNSLDQSLTILDVSPAETPTLTGVALLVVARPNAQAEAEG